MSDAGAGPFAFGMELGDCIEEIRSEDPEALSEEERREVRTLADAGAGDGVHRLQRHPKDIFADAARRDAKLLHALLALRLSPQRSGVAERLIAYVLPRLDLADALLAGGAPLTPATLHYFLHTCEDREARRVGLAWLLARRARYPDGVCIAEMVPKSMQERGDEAELGAELGALVSALRGSGTWFRADVLPGAQHWLWRAATPHTLRGILVLSEGVNLGTFADLLCDPARDALTSEMLHSAAFDASMRGRACTFVLDAAQLCARSRTARELLGREDFLRRAASERESPPCAAVLLRILARGFDVHRDLVEHAGRRGSVEEVEAIARRLGASFGENALARGALRERSGAKLRALLRLSDFDMEIAPHGTPHLLDRARGVVDDDVLLAMYDATRSVEARSRALAELPIRLLREVMDAE